MRIDPVRQEEMYDKIRTNIRRRKGEGGGEEYKSNNKKVLAMGSW